MARIPPHSVDTVIVGNGPSALLLSYLLHGNIPTYDPLCPHPDQILHAKLKNNPDLLHLDVDFLTEHFSASRFSYSTQALPINTLLDTLVRPLGETGDAEERTCIAWKQCPEHAVGHVVLGNTDRPGGQWVDNPVKASGDIGTLSYAGMLSLPGYSFGQHYRHTHGQPMPPYLRPSRREVADYFAAYPAQVGIEDAIYCNQILSGISRSGRGFHIASHNISCKRLVLASGIFTGLIPPRELLQPLLSLPCTTAPHPSEPLLVIGSGFSAADVIVSTPPSQKIIHVFKWAPEKSPSPLRACHQAAYPEYAGVYRKMKIAAFSSSASKDKRPKARRASSNFDLERDWGSMYEGLPNTAVINVEMDHDSALVTLRTDDGVTFQRKIGSFVYLVGRRGSLNYLDDRLEKEVWPSSDGRTLLSGQSLRQKAIDNLEVAKSIFIIGSLTGDSLIRFSYGTCAFAAGQIMERKESRGHVWGCNGIGQSSKSSSPYLGAMNGLDGHSSASRRLPPLG